MASKKYNKTNFFKHSFCIFKKADLSIIEGKNPDYTSKSGSSYYYLNNALYRLSNHWGRVANCRWRLEDIDRNTKDLKLGVARWEDFYPNNEQENLFYIHLGADKEISFQHKDNPMYSGSECLRNTGDTAKTMRELREVIDADKWAHYLHYDDLEMLRSEIIHHLIYTRKSLLEIKRLYL